MIFNNCQTYTNTKWGRNWEYKYINLPKKVSAFLAFLSKLIIIYYFYGRIQNICFFPFEHIKQNPLFVIISFILKIRIFLDRDWNKLLDPLIVQFNSKSNENRNISKVDFLAPKDSTWSSEDLLQFNTMTAADLKTKENDGRLLTSTAAAGWPARMVRSAANQHAP